MPHETAVHGALADRSNARALIDRSLAIVLTAGTFVLPLVFTVALSDVFALPKTVVIAAVLVAGYGFLQQMGRDPIWQVLNKGRIFSTLGQANALAAYLVLVLPLALALAGVSGKVGRAISTLTAVAIAAALALTLSRGGYLGIGTALVVFALCVIRRSSLTRRRVASGAGLVLAMLGLIAFLPPVTRSVERIADRGLLTVNLAEGSTASHLDLWAVGARIALDHPLLGVGPEIYPRLFPRYRDAVLPPARAAIMARFRPESPHNVPLAIAAGAGVPALIAYLAFVLLAMSAGWRQLRQTSPSERLLIAALLASVSGHLVTDVFMTAEVSGSWIFWILLGALCAARGRQIEAGEPGETIGAMVSA